MSFLKNVTIEDCGVGISMPKGSDMVMDGVVTKKCGTGIEERDPPSLLATLGVPKEYAHELLALLKVLITTGAVSQSAVAEEVGKSTLGKLLDNANSITTLVNNLVQMGSTVGFPALVEILSKMLGG